MSKVQASVEEEKIIVTLAGDSKFRPKLKKIFGSFDNFNFIWNEMTFSDFVSIGLRENDYDLLSNLRNNGFKEKEWEILKKNNIKITTFLSKDYPAPLKQISDPPPVLFVRGDLLYKEAIGMVGSRKASRYGAQVAQTLSEDLANAGLAIVSGLAIGIDAISHKGALASKGKTIAVLGSSIDDNSIYPQTNWSLAQKILDFGGALMSEYPPGHDIYKYNFVERNRVISGLSRGVLVVEAREKSGALITADFAVSEGRDVFAVPHNITRLESIGTNNLIKDGAFPVTCAEDVLSEFGIEKTKQVSPELNDEKERLIASFLKKGVSDINIIAQDAGLTISEASSTLSMMEIRGIVVKRGAQEFVLKK